MKKILIAASLFLSINCKKIERTFDPKYCWECSTLATGGVGDTETIRTVTVTSHCNMTTLDMFSFKNKATTYVEKLDGSWAKTVTNCWRK